MTNYIIRRILGLLPTLFIIITLSFVIMKIAPGGPFAKERPIPPEILKNIEKKYDLDKPLWFQYGKYLGQIVTGDLGYSYKKQDYTVNELIFDALPNSLFLGIMSMIVALILGSSVGILSALKQNTWIDYSTMSVAVIGISVPLFVIGPILQYVFATQLNWFPTAGWISNPRTPWTSILMPVLTLSLPYFAYIARLSRASVLEVLRSDYIRTAYSKGLSTRRIIFKHVIKGASLPVVSYLGPAFAAIITGAIVVERIFRIPGTGKLAVDGALNRDYTLIMGTVIVYAVILLLMNLIVDIIYGFLDPRISYK
jgi:oligopeptide transport system permease protein